MLSLILRLMVSFLAFQNNIKFVLEIFQDYLFAFKDYLVAFNQTLLAHY